jgi:hypothetical protein
MESSLDLDVASSSTNENNDLSLGVRPDYKLIGLNK